MVRLYGNPSAYWKDVLTRLPTKRVIEIAGGYLWSCCRIYGCWFDYTRRDARTHTVVSQGDIGNRDVRLCAVGNDLNVEGFGIDTAFLWHGHPLKKAKNGVHLN